MTSLLELRDVQVLLDGSRPARANLCARDVMGTCQNIMGVPASEGGEGAPITNCKEHIDPTKRR